MDKKVSRHVRENVKDIKRLFGGDKTFDLIIHNFQVGGYPAALVFLDGFIKDEMLWVLRSLQNTTREELLPNPMKNILERHIPYYEVESVSSLGEAVDWILSGPQVLFLEGEREAIVLDGREWLSRTPEEPPIEKATRGPSDGFVETMLFNLTLIRRRIRDPKLRAEHYQIGERSKNDLALVYMHDLVDMGLVEDIRHKLENIVVDGLPLADKSVEAFLSGTTYSLFPMVRYTERPDIAAAHLLEGHLAVIVDNSPSVLLLPAPLLSHIQSIEDYRQGALTGTYLKLLRLLSILMSTLLPPLWLLIVNYKGYLPPIFDIIGPKGEITIPLYLQFALASLGIDMIRIASIHTPEAMATSLGIIGALILGEFAVEVGLFQPEVIFYMAVAAIASFTIVGKEVAVSLRVYRLVLILFTGMFGVVGFLLPIGALFYLLVKNKSFGVPYLWPLIPFNYQSLRAFLFTEPILTLSPYRPKYWEAEDDKRLPD